MQRCGDDEEYGYEDDDSSWAAKQRKDHFEQEDED